MPTFNIVKKSNIQKTFKTSKIIDDYDLKIKKEVTETFQGSLPIENQQWNIGIICGASGTGKTTIAETLFENDFYTHDFDNKAVIDNMPGDSVKDITKMFNTVGFGTIWSWLKPYNVLSQGEQMRVNLAAALLQNKTRIVFDEFTSVVNREVAKTASVAISKAVKRENKQFIAVTCHKDICEWLEPDWIFDTDNMSFQLTRGLLRRPNIEIDIYRQKNSWDIFKKYHYLNTDINNASDQYVGYFNNEPIVFFAVLHFPHPKNKKIKVGHRLVVLPDFQGLGIGHKFSSVIASHYKQQGFDFMIRSSNNALFLQRQRDPNWAITDFGRTRFSHSKSVNMNSTIRANKNTISYKYIGS